MSAHTEGRITVDNKVDGPMLVSDAGADLLIGGDGNTAEVINPADARRLVACWNACEGLDTEAIEGLTEVGGVACLAVDSRNYMRERDQARADLAAARALLTEVLAAEDIMARGEVLGMNEVKSRYERISALLKGGA